MPFDTFTLNLYSSLLKSNNSILYISTSFFGNSTEILFLAYSYSFLPLTLIAEYIDTSWLYVPTNEFNVSIILSFVIPHFLSSRTLPSVSNVSVNTPNLTVAIYKKYDKDDTKIKPFKMFI